MRFSWGAWEVLTGMVTFLMWEYDRGMVKVGKTGGTGWTGAVSYTHLDFDKEGAVYTAHRNTDVLWHLFFGFGTDYGVPDYGCHSGNHPLSVPAEVHYRRSGCRCGKILIFYGKGFFPVLHPLSRRTAVWVSPLHDI